MSRRLLSLAAALCLCPAALAADKAPDWVEPMRKAHAKFTGTKGTLALFGDSITVSLAFWASLPDSHKNLSPEAAAAFRLVNGHIHKDCWRKWRGPKYGNQGTMTVRWPHDNVGTWLKDLNPETAVILFGTNDLGGVPLAEYEKKLRDVVRRCLDNGTVVILTTLPPRSGALEKARGYAEAARRVAADLHVPVCDYFAECLKRRPDDWDGAAPAWKDYSTYEVPTLISRDGVHPSNPKKYSGDYSEEALKSSGFGLRTYLTMMSYAAVIRHVLAPAEKTASPNFVIVYADDLGYGDLGCYGAKGWATPNLDRMATEGVRFTDFYVAQAVCSASRTALLTGCYPNRVGILGALGPASKHGISDREKTIADVLKSRRYATAIYGKWHLGHHPKFLPTRHGFDDYYGLPYSNDMWPRHPTAKFPDLPLIEGEKVIATNPDQSKLTTAYTERAVRFIDTNHDRPFFLYVPHAMPHVPLFVSDKHRGKSRQGLYGDVVAEIDWSVGQILDALKRNKIDERTLVIFASDNGPWLSYGEHAGTAGQLREGKGTSFEGGVRVPCVMRWPGRVPAGRVCREPVMTIDVLPTLAHLAGATLPELPIDGKDVWPLIEGKTGAKSPQEAYYFYWDRELQAVRSGKWKLHFPHGYRTLAGKPGGKDGKPVAYTQDRTPLALFDLEADQGEKRNVAEEHPDVVKQLEKLADRAREELGDSARKVKGKGVREPGTI